MRDRLKGTYVLYAYLCLIRLTYALIYESYLHKMFTYQCNIVKNLLFRSLLNLNT